MQEPTVIIIPLDALLVASGVPQALVPTLIDVILTTIQITGRIYDNNCAFQPTSLVVPLDLQAAQNGCVSGQNLSDAVIIEECRHFSLIVEVGTLNIDVAAISQALIGGLSPEEAAVITANIVQGLPGVYSGQILPTISAAVDLCYI